MKNQFNQWVFFTIMPTLSPLAFSCTKLAVGIFFCLFQEVGWHEGGRWRAICSHLCNVNQVATGKVCAPSLRKTNPAASRLGASQVSWSQKSSKPEHLSWIQPKHHRKSFHANVFDIMKPLFTESELGQAIPNGSWRRKVGEERIGPTILVASGEDKAKSVIS